MVHIQGNKILLNTEEVAEILKQYSNSKPSITITDGEGLYVNYTIELTTKYIHKENNEIIIRRNVEEE